MLKVIGQLRKFTASRPVLDKILSDQMEKVCEEATKKWVRTTLDFTPKFTGQSWASIQMAANLVGISVNTNPVNALAGRLSNLKRYSKADVGNASIEKNKNSYVFRYNSTVPQIIENEFGPGGTPIGFPKLSEYQRPQPWRAIEKANKVWNDHVDQNFIKVNHNLGQAIQITMVRVG